MLGRNFLTVFFSIETILFHWLLFLVHRALNKCINKLLKPYKENFITIDSIKSEIVSFYSIDKFDDY